MEGAFGEDAAEVETVLEGLGVEGVVKGLGEEGFPGAGEGDDSGEDGEGGFGFEGTAGVGDGCGGSEEFSDGGGFFSGVVEDIFAEELFDLEDGVDGFGGDVEGGVLVEEEGGVVAVEDDDVELFAGAAGGVEDEGLGDLVAFGEVVGEELGPGEFGEVAFRAGMAEVFEGGVEFGGHLGLEAEEDFAEIDGGFGIFGFHGVPFEEEDRGFCHELTRMGTNGKK